MERKLQERIHELNEEKAMRKGYFDLNYAMFFEPEGGINTPGEFTEELLAWAKREKRELSVLAEGMDLSRWKTLYLQAGKSGAGRTE